MIKTLQAIEDANVVVLLLDAQQAITEQDAHIAGYILEAGRALVVAVNKWDAADAGAARRRSSATSTASSRFLAFAEHALHLGARGPRHRRADEVGATRRTPPRWRSCRRRG